MSLTPECESNRVSGKCHGMISKPSAGDLLLLAPKIDHLRWCRDSKRPVLYNFVLSGNGESFTSSKLNWNHLLEEIRKDFGGNIRNVTFSVILWRGVSVNIFDWIEAGMQSSGKRLFTATDCNDLQREGSCTVKLISVSHTSLSSHDVEDGGQRKST